MTLLSSATQCSQPDRAFAHHIVTLMFHCYRPVMLANTTSLERMDDNDDDTCNALAHTQAQDTEPPGHPQQPCPAAIAHLQRLDD